MCIQILLEVMAATFMLNSDYIRRQAVLRHTLGKLFTYVHVTATLKNVICQTFEDILMYCIHAEVRTAKLIFLVRCKVGVCSVHQRGKTKESDMSRCTLYLDKQLPNVKG